MTDRINYTTWWHDRSEQEKRKQNLFNGLYFGINADVPYTIAKLDGFPVQSRICSEPTGYAHEKATEAGVRFAQAVKPMLIAIANGEVSGNMIDVPLRLSQVEVRLLLWLCNQAALWADGRLNETSDDLGLDKDLTDLPYYDDETSAAALGSFVRAAIADVLVQHSGSLEARTHHLTHERPGHRGGVDERAAPVDPSKRKKWGLF